MPQTEPMTPEAFARKLQEFAEGLEIPKMVTAPEVLRFYETAKKAERDEWEKLIAQRDRDILIAAGDRLCAACPCDMSNRCGYMYEGEEQHACLDRKAILAPLADLGEARRG